MHTVGRLLPISLLGCLVGCNNAGPTSAIPSPSAPTAFVVSGVVTEVVDGVLRPIPNQFLALFVQQNEGLPSGLVSLGTSQYLATDQNGRYAAEVPKSRVFVSASWGKRQPCIASGAVDGNTTLDVDVSRAAATPPVGAGPLVTGVIYETTPEGRRPLQRAEAWLDIGSDQYVANTETDAEGRFYFCRVITSVRMDVSKEGYQPWSQSISGAGDKFVEIELKR